MSPLYKLMVPSDRPNIKVSGRIGIVPDVEIVGGWYRCARSTLPSSLSRLTFQVFFQPLGPYKPPPPTTIQNFYHLDDFFVVSRQMKEFIESRLCGGVETQAIDMRYRDGNPVPEPYFALKIVRTIDCIDPQQSLFHDYGIGKDVPFSERTATYELNDALAPEFANAGARQYRSFPPLRHTTKLHLVESAIPSDALLFTPAFWPGQLLVSIEFAKELANACTGGTPGYYFWTIGPRMLRAATTR